MADEINKADETATAPAATAAESKPVQAVKQAPPPIRRGAKYIGDGVEHIPSVPMRDLTWEETRAAFGDSFEQRRHAIEVLYPHLYAWDPPKRKGDKE